MATLITLASAAIITCLSLSAVDGDTIKCNGENMRIMEPGSPNKSGIDTPEIRNADCSHAAKWLPGRSFSWCD